MKKLLLTLCFCLSLSAQMFEPKTVADVSELSQIPAALGLGKVTVTDENQGGNFVFVSTANLPSWASTDVIGMAYTDASSTGKWIRRWDGPVNARWFGAVGDHVTDDTAAIQAAFDFCDSFVSEAPTYGPAPSLFFTAGWYRIEGTISSVKDAYPAYQGSRIVVFGEGMDQTYFYGPGTTGKPIWYLKNHTAVSFHDVTFRGDAGSTSTCDYTQRIGLWRYDANNYHDYNLSFAFLGRGVVIDCWLNNWASMRDIEFYGCTVGIQALEVKAGNYDDLYFQACGVGIMATDQRGARWSVNAQGLGSVSALPFVHRFRDAENVTISLGYGEANNDKPVLSAGVPQSYSSIGASVAANGTTITFPITAYHLLTPSSGSGDELCRITITSDSVLSDVVNYIHASLTYPKLVTGPARQSTNYITVEATGTVVSDISGINFTLTEFLGNPTRPGSGSVIGLNVLNGTVEGSSSYDNTGSTIALDYVSDSQIMVGRAHYGQRYDLVSWTTNTHDVDLKLSAHDPSFVLRLAERDAKPINICKDPEVECGLRGVQLAAVSSYDSTVTYDGTQTVGRGGSYRFVPTVGPAAKTLAAKNFQFSTDGVDFADKDVAISFAMLTPTNALAVRPDGFSVSAGGTGYTDGSASITVGGLPIYVDLTTSGGVITGATWVHGYAEDNTITAYSVVQSGGSGGTITPTAYSATGWMSAKNPKYAIIAFDSSGNGYGYFTGAYQTPHGASGSEWSWMYKTIHIPATVSYVYFQVAVGYPSGGLDGSEVIYIDNITISDVTGRIPNYHDLAALQVTTIDPLTPEGAAVLSASLSGSTWLTPRIDHPVQIVTSATATPQFFLSATNVWDGAWFRVANQDGVNSLDVDNTDGSTLIKTIIPTSWGLFQWDADNSTWELVGYGGL